MIRISLVIPTHNRAVPLLAALESVVRQSLPAEEWECVVVDNNSTDDTAERFAAFRSAHPGVRLRMVRETGPGVSYARNRGLREAAAPLVAFIDDDERVNADFLRAYADFFDTHPGAVVAGGSRCRSPIRWTSAPTCGLSRQDGCPVAGIWLSGVRGWSVTGGSTPRWDV